MILPLEEDSNGSGWLASDCIEFRICFIRIRWHVHVEEEVVVHAVQLQKTLRVRMNEVRIV